MATRQFLRMMTAPASSSSRVRVDGKFFRLGAEKFHVKGVAYGPFAPNETGEPFPNPDRTEQDFDQIVTLGANTIRVYQTPPRWLLDLAWQAGLKVLIDVPLNKQGCFLEIERRRQETNREVRNTIKAGRDHLAVLGYVVVNEIPADIVRWSGAEAVTNRIEELVAEAKSIDSDVLCSFANFPPTEYIRPRNLDFVSFNVYLHERPAFEGYLARLQMQAEGQPLLLSECGIDSWREGEERKCEILSWQIESAFRAGLAGAVVFSYTDEWHVAGRAVEDWSMGLTDKARQPKASFHTVQRQFAVAPYFPLPNTPKVSVVVAGYNCEKTLPICLDSLRRLRYPDYEIIFVDDGSTDTTSTIGRTADGIRYVPQPHHGLSVARNTGTVAAQGDIIAFTDADCRADEDWLYYMVGEFQRTGFAGMGGPNLLPPDDSPLAASVMVSPGGPAHVMLTDREAEHIPGCNMAFCRSALQTIGGFDPVFRRAGDDVDICWRLQQRGYRIGFSAAGFVWHYRRSTVRAYLRQQEGYGEAEALLERKHPENFNKLGGGLWRGRIYTSAQIGVVPRRGVIYHGVFGTGMFQTMYAGEPSLSLMLFTSLEFHVLVTLPLVVLSVPFHFLWPVPLLTLGTSLGLSLAAAWQANLPRDRRRFWSRPLIALLFFLQPIARGWARYRARFYRDSIPASAMAEYQNATKTTSSPLHACLHYWSEHDYDRVDWINAIMEKLDQQGWTSKPDLGWNHYDVEIHGNRWSRLQLITARETLSDGHHVLRCRLRAQWSLAATAVFWLVLAVELLIIGWWAHRVPWLWMLPLSMPLLGWYWDQEKRDLQAVVTHSLDRLAEEKSLVKTPAPSSAGRNPWNPTAPTSRST